MFGDKTQMWIIMMGWVGQATNSGPGRMDWASARWNLDGGWRMDTENDIQNMLSLSLSLSLSCSLFLGSLSIIYPLTNDQHESASAGVGPLPPLHLLAALKPLPTHAADAGAGILLTYVNPAARYSQTTICTAHPCPCPGARACS
jgi:hypothetical protein